MRTHQYGFQNVSHPQNVYHISFFSDRYLLAIVAVLVAKVVVFTEVAGALKEVNIFSNTGR